MGFSHLSRNHGYQMIHAPGPNITGLQYPCVLKLTAHYQARSLSEHLKSCHQIARNLHTLIRRGSQPNALCRCPKKLRQLSLCGLGVRSMRARSNLHRGPCLGLAKLVIARSCAIASSCETEPTKVQASADKNDQILPRRGHV